VTSPRRARKTATPRAGLFGLLGQGNLGNDGSLEAVLSYLRTKHPDVALDVMCSGPRVVVARYGIPVTRLHWYNPERQRGPGPVALAGRSLGLVLGMGIDAFRTASWVRRHDAVIVPGMGVLEATVPIRPWQTPYSMFLLCAAGRLFGTKIALVSVGTNVIHQRITRWLITTSARLAHYRSYRDDTSKDAMRQMGVDISGDAVYPDVVFSLAPPDGDPGTAGAVGVGIMDYSGGNDDRPDADEIRSSYIKKMTRFALWLIDNGHPVRLFTSDSADERIVQQVLSNLRTERPGLSPSKVIAEPVSSLDELMRQTASVETVVATRYHNVLYALKLAKPTLSLGYAVKHDALMADMGLSRFCLPVKSLDVAQMIELYTELEEEAAQLRLLMTERNAAKAQLVAQQFNELSVVLFPGTEADTPLSHEPAGTGIL
jgi:polysaccharide pyruvyl transferase WcaK-like protein